MRATARSATATIRVALSTVLLGLAGSACSDAAPSTADAARPSDGRSEDTCEDLLAMSVPGHQGTVSVSLRRDGGWATVTGDWVASDPSLSPDGAEVVVVRAEGSYESAGPGATELWVVDPDTLRTRDLVDGASDTWETDPDWSPDGSTIVFSHSTGGAGGGVQLMTVPAGGGAASPLTDATVRRDVLAAWSPDGTEVAFVRLSEAEGAPSTVMVVEVASSEVRAVAEVEPVSAEVASVTWTPDGRSLLLGGRGLGVRLVDVATGTVTEMDTEATDLAWSADGERLHLLEAQGAEYVQPAVGRVVDGEIVHDATTPHDGAYAHPYVRLDVGPCLPPLDR